MSSCGHRHKTTKVKHVRDTHHHHLTRFNTWGGKNVFVWMKLLLRVEQLNHPFLSLCFREKLFVDERKDAICWSWSQPALVCSKSNSPTNKTPIKSTGPKKKSQASQLVLKRNPKQVNWSQKKPKQVNWSLKDIPSKSTGPRKKPQTNHLVPKRNPKQVNQSHKRNPKQ